MNWHISKVYRKRKKATKSRTKNQHRLRNFSSQFTRVERLCSRSVDGQTVKLVVGAEAVDLD